MKHDGVSEVVGALILVAIGVLAMGIVILVLVSGSLPGSVPSFSGFISNSSNTIYISHEGGDPIWRGQYRILVDGVDETWNFTKSITDPFSAGKVMNASLPKMPSRVVMVFNTSGGGGTVLLSADLVKQVVPTPDGWYDIGWLYRKKITIDHTKVPSVQYNFPVLISLADVDLSARAQHDADDILFTASDGMTKLPHEVEAYTWNSGTTVAWVKVPALSSVTDTVIYLYYGASDATSQEDPENVWDANYKGVWHHDHDFLDSTSNGNTGTNNASVNTAAKIGNGQDYNGNAEVNVGSGSSIDSLFAGGGTISAWIYPHAYGNFGRIADKALVTNGGGGWTFQIDGSGTKVTTNALRFGRGFDGTRGGWNTGDNTISLNQWQYVTLVYTDASSADPLFYINGVYKAPTETETPSGSPQSDADNSMTIGNWAGVTPPRYFDGIIDEIRLSKTSRSADWILTEYNNQNNPGVGGFLLSISTPQMIISMS